MAKDIVNGVLITGLIFFISVFIPILGFIGALFIPLPILFYRLKLGRHFGAIVPAVAGLLMAVVIGNVSLDLLFFAELLLIGFILGELIRFNISLEKTVAFTAGCALGSGLMALFLFSLVAGQGIFSIVTQYVAKNLELTMVLYRQMGMPQESIQLITQSLDKIQAVLVSIIPALMTMSTLLVIWINVLLAKPLLEKKYLFYPDFGPLNRWKTPEPLVWGVIGCAVALFLPVTTIRLIALNGLLILMTLYFFQGIAIVSFYFEKKRFPRIIRIFLYTLIALQQLVLLAVIGLGFFDLWANFRKLDRPAGPA